MRRAYSSILIRRMRSNLTFSNERRSPSRRAIRAYKKWTMSTGHTIAQDGGISSPGRGGQKRVADTKTLHRAPGLDRDRNRGMNVQRKHNDTDPHFSPLDLPLVSVALISTPFSLQKVQDTRQGEVLAVLGWRWRDALALARLTEWVLLLGWWNLISLRVGLGWRHLERAEHGDLDCLWMVNVGRALLWNGCIILGVVSTVELMEHVALLGCSKGILRVLLALLLLRLCLGLEVQEESGCGEHRPGRGAEHLSSVCCLQTTDALHDGPRRARCRQGQRRRQRKKDGQQNLGTPHTMLPFHAVTPKLFFFVHTFHSFIDQSSLQEDTEIIPSAPSTDAFLAELVPLQRAVW